MGILQKDYKMQLTMLHVFCIVKYVVPELTEGVIYEQNTFPSFFPSKWNISHGHVIQIPFKIFLRTGLDHVDQADQADKVEVREAVKNVLADFARQGGGVPPLSVKLF